MIKFLRIIVCILCTVNSYSQTNNFRKAILKSDAILVSNNYSYDTIRVNDFTKEVYLKINTINKVLKNKLPIVIDSITALVLQDGEDFYSPIYDGSDGDCIGIIEEINEEDEQEYNIFFLKKEKDRYVAYLRFEKIKHNKYRKYTKQIESLSTIESINEEKERYEKTLDWFIDNEILPDQDFITYYKQKKIIVDSVQYSETQYEKALQLLKVGNESFLPMLRRKYFEEIKKHYINEMEKVIRLSDPGYGDFYKFSRLAEAITNNYDDDYNSVNDLMDDLLTNTCYSDYKKEEIMKHLLEVVKEWKLQPKE